jgi:hypothetical protein
MPRGQKKTPISQTKHIVYSVIEKNRKALAYFERKLMHEIHVDDCLQVNNCDVINHAVNLAYEYDRPKTRRRDDV